MAPSSRRAGKRRANDTAKPRAGASNGQVPAVYQDLLDEVGPQVEELAERPVKRRRILPGGRAKQEVKDEQEVHDRSWGGLANLPTSSPGPPIALQTVEDSDDSDDSFEWEDVPVVKEDPATASDDFDDIDDGDEKLVFTIGGEDENISTRKRRGRKPPTLEERRRRLEIHKAHLLCLIYHCAVRNKWCNEEAVQRACRAQVPLSKSVVERLSPELHIRQAERSRLFKESITILTTFWRNTFTLTAEGLRRPIWDSPADDAINTEAFVDRNEFKRKAKHMSGSADYGAQLFCAFLRGLGVETRLVCSLQPLPFTAAGASMLPRAPTMPTVYIKDDDPPEEPKQESPVKLQRIARMGRGRRPPTKAVSQSTVPQSVARKTATVPRPRHPIFWVEVFDEAFQKWVSVDPIATASVARPLLLEPGLSDPENLLSYVVAFESPGYARDVTRRYTKAYNAKTRKLRVEYTERGIAWYAKALKPFRRRRATDRDHLEDATFVQKDMSEGMPRNIEDFKGHPVYVLERHLHRDEVIHPRREAGKIGQNSKAANLSNLESVYRRQDVHNVKSADRWFRLGRQMKQGAEPLKTVVSRRRRQQSGSADADVAELLEQDKTKLYAHFQTELYVPAPVRHGKIEKNAFGNLDIYVPTMIPPGAAHVVADRARDAARLLGISFADAVVGFKFKGRHGTAVTRGVVVASEHADAMVAALEGMMELQKEEVAEQRMLRACAWWSKLTHGLQILERVKQYRHPDEEEDDDDEAALREVQAELKHYGEDASTEGLILEPELGTIEVVVSPHAVPPPSPLPIGRLTDLFEEPDEEGGGFLPERYSPGVLDPVATDQQGDVNADEVEGGGFVVSDPVEAGGGFVADEVIQSGGGFMADDANENGGGFLSDVSEANAPMLPTQEGVRSNTHPSTTKATTPPPNPLSPKPQSDTKPSAPSAHNSPPTEQPRSDDKSPPQHELPAKSPSSEAQVADDESLLSHDPDDDEVEPDWID